MRAGPSLWVASATMILIACDPGGRNSLGYETVDLFQGDDRERVTTSPRFDTLWTYGGIGDSILGTADRIAAFPNGDAAVLDGAGPQVHRIGPTGVVWSWGRRGQGPGEIEQPRAIAVDERGRVVIGDSRNRRLTWLTGTGMWIRDATLPQPTGELTTGVVEGIVSLRGGEYIVYQGDVQPWIRLAESGELVEVVPLPWSGFRQMHPLQTLGKVTHGFSRALWIFGFSHGNGFFVFSGNGDTGAYPYIDHSSFRDLVVQPLGGGRKGVQMRLDYPPGAARRKAQDLATRADTLYVLVQNQVLDRYSVSTGEYLESIVLPGPIIRMAMTGDTLLVIDATELFPSISALRQKERE